MRRRRIIATNEAQTVSAQRRSPTSVVAGARANPFMFGLLGALGVLVALAIGGIVNQLATVLVYIGVAIFLALGLDPIVTSIERKLPGPRPSRSSSPASSWRSPASSSPSSRSWSSRSPT